MPRHSPSAPRDRKPSKSATTRRQTVSTRPSTRSRGSNPWLGRLESGWRSVEPSHIDALTPDNRLPKRLQHDPCSLYDGTLLRMLAVPEHLLAAHPDLTRL